MLESANSLLSPGSPLRRKCRNDLKRVVAGVLSCVASVIGGLGVFGCCKVLQPLGLVTKAQRRPSSGGRADQPLKSANRLDHPEMAAQVFEVDDDVVELRVAIRIIFGNR